MRSKSHEKRRSAKVAKKLAQAGPRRVRGLILERGLVFETLPDRKVLEVMR